MKSHQPFESFDVSLKTPAGLLEGTVKVPDQIIPITDIVPLFRSFGERVMSLEEEKCRSSGETISCRKGCASCCRMMVPVSPPEAFRLRKTITHLPESQQGQIRERIATIKTALLDNGLLFPLQELGESTLQKSDHDIEPLNQAYYSLRLPCPFLENEVCSIYEDRPAACRELLVTSPAELCQDLTANPIHALPVHLRIGTVLSLLWKDLTEGPARLIPLPLALDWAERHSGEDTLAWNGPQLLEKGMNQMWAYLNQSPSPPSKNEE